MKNPLKYEPVAVQFVVMVAIGGFAAFVLKWSPQQMVEVLTASGALMAFLTRQAVTPTAKIETIDITQEEKTP